MTDDFANQAVSYLCGDLDRGRQAEFEKLLERDPVAAAGLKACADAMARYAAAEAGEWPFDPRERAEMAARIIEASGAGRPRRMSRLAWLWPIAAAILLALNLWQWAIRPGPPRPLSAGRTRGAAYEPTDGAAEGPAAAGRTKPAVPAAPPRETNTQVAKAMARLAALRQEYSRLQISKNELNAEYARILQQLAAQEIMAQGASRVVAMELVDSASYANGGRPGLFDLSTAQLTKPGIVAAGPAAGTGETAPSPAPPVQNSAVSTNPPAASGPATGTPAGVASSVPAGDAETASVTGASVPGTTTIVNSTSGTSAPSSAQPAPTDTQSSASGTTPAPAGPAQASPTPASSSASGTPYAVSLFDEAQEQGYMDLYNLPSVAADQTLQLWVLPAGSDNFQNVGQVPAEYYGGSGSIYYKLPDGTATPAQIMVTVEPRSSTLATPTGTVVLRGP